ncbi:hypothetical protein H4Q26_016447 [Puccinia striiformis f. sp. tritici PST-130]|nr:hypothetical protein H4Q26_016447 [Puccinia striiformis f. sp. tritici PST-130]
MNLFNTTCTPNNKKGTINYYPQLELQTYLTIFKANNHGTNIFIEDILISHFLEAYLYHIASPEDIFKCLQGTSSLTSLIYSSACGQFLLNLIVR